MKIKQKEKAKQLKYEEIKNGYVFSFERIITQNDQQMFVELTGDFNPLHVDPVFGEKSKFGRNIVHGLLVGSFFSTLVGMYCPGEKNLYLGQSYSFRQPIFVGDKIEIRGTVMGKNDSVKLITIKTEVWKDGVIAISGDAKVSFLE